MNILEHPIYKEIYELCLEIEKFPASEHQTKVAIQASSLQQSAAKLVGSLREVKLNVLTGMEAVPTLARILRICIDAGITDKLNKTSDGLEPAGVEEGK